MPKKIRIQVSGDLYERLAACRDRYGFRSMQRMIRAMAEMLERKALEPQEEPDYTAELFDTLCNSEFAAYGDAPVRHNNKDIETI